MTLVTLRAGASRASRASRHALRTLRASVPAYATIGFDPTAINVESAPRRRRGQSVARQFRRRDFQAARCVDFQTATRDDVQFATAAARS